MILPNSQCRSNTNHSPPSQPFAPRLEFSAHALRPTFWTVETTVVVAVGDHRFRFPLALASARTARAVMLCRLGDDSARFGHERCWVFGDWYLGVTLGQFDADFRHFLFLFGDRCRLL